jgi:hypothetical protein
LTTRPHEAARLPLPPIRTRGPRFWSKNTRTGISPDPPEPTVRLTVEADRWRQQLVIELIPEYRNPLLLGLPNRSPSARSTRRRVGSASTVDSAHLDQLFASGRRTESKKSDLPNRFRLTSGLGRGESFTMIRCGSHLSHNSRESKQQSMTTKTCCFVRANVAAQRINRESPTACQSDPLHYAAASV